VSDNPTDTSRWKLVSFLLAGVLIPIVVALIPWTLDHWTAQNALQYSVVGPLTANKATAVSVKVSNVGTESQHNVQVWLPLDVQPEYVTETDKNGLPHMVTKNPVTYINSSPQPTTTEKRDNTSILTFSILRPNESITITAFVIGGTPLLYPFAFDGMRVVSDNVVATKQEDSHEFDFIFKMGTGLFVGFIVFFLLFAFYYEVLVPVEKKRADLQKQLDKLPAGK
jgi:hypothetical protein